MAIYHLSVKTVSRSAGRSATAAAAYRAGVEITDERTGEIHDYARKGGVESAELVLPAGAPEWAADRAALWNAAEQAETRKNSTVAREFEVALPAELSAEDRKQLAHDFARELVERYRLVADVAIHAPGREGDNRNHHAHILCTTRSLEAEGFTAKTRELDDLKTGAVKEWRERWASLTNAALERAGVAERIDHRSNAERGIEAAPSQHLGPAATGIERRTGEPSRKRMDFEAEVADRLARAKEAGELERQGRQIDRLILDLSGDLAAAKAEAAQVAAAFAGLSVAELAAEIDLTRRRLQPTDELARLDQHRHGLAEQHWQALAEAERHRREAEAFRAAHGVQAWLHGRGWGHSVPLLAMEQAQEAAQAKAEQAKAALQAHDEAYTAAVWRIRGEQRPDDERLAALKEARDAALRAEADRQARPAPSPAPSRRPTHRPAAERDDDLSM